MTPAWLSHRIAIVDTETTGVDESARVVELAVVILDAGEVRSRWSTRLDPGIPIPAEATAFHGITDADVKDAPGFGDIASAFFLETEGAYLAAYNAPYDHRLLVGEMRRRAPYFLAPVDAWLDPCVWANHVDKFKRGKKLTDVALRRNISVAGAHGAEKDAEICAAVMLCMSREKFLPDTMADLLSWQTEARVAQAADRAAYLARAGRK